MKYCAPGSLVADTLMTPLLPSVTVLHIEGALSRRKHVGERAEQLATPFGSQRTAVSSTDHVPDRLFVLDPLGSTANVPPQLVLFESQNWFAALTDRNEPLGMAAPAD